MTEASIDRRPALRLGLAAVVIADLISFYFVLADARAAARMNGVVLGGVGGLLSHPGVGVGVILAGIAASVAFASQPGRLWYGAIALGSLTLLSTVHAQLFGSPWRHLYYSGLCLAGWLAGLTVSRRSDRSTDESYARMGSLALLGAAYLSAGISKIAFGGLDWISGLPIQAVIVAQDGLVADGAAGAYRVWVVNTPTVVALMSVLTVCFELAGPLMIAGRRLRLVVVFGLLAMHLNIYVLTPILYWESMVLLLLFGLSAESGDQPSQAADPALLRGRPFIIAAVALAFCAVIAVGYQAVRFRDSRAPGSPDEGQAATAHATSAPTPRQMGPFAVGQAVTDAWTINELLVAGDTIVIVLLGEAGRPRFELTCDAPYRSPFDLERVHILFSQHVEFQQLEDAGWAIRRRLEEATAGADPCEKLAQWRGPAQ